MSKALLVFVGALIIGTVFVWYPVQVILVGIVACVYATSR